MLKIGGTDLLHVSEIATAGRHGVNKVIGHIDVIRNLLQRLLFKKVHFDQAE
jgi:hypothetical protein